MRRLLAKAVNIAKTLIKAATKPKPSPAKPPAPKPAAASAAQGPTARESNPLLYGIRQRIR